MNYEDWSFVMIKLDESSLNFFLQNMNKIEDPLSFLLIVRSIYDMIKSGDLLAPEFILKAVEQNILLKNKDNVLVL